MHVYERSIWDNGCEYGPEGAVLHQTFDGAAGDPAGAESIMLNDRVSWFAHGITAAEVNALRKCGGHWNYSLPEGAYIVVVRRVEVLP